MNDWLNKYDFRNIQTPFDIENILRADEKLLAQWKRKPFYLDIAGTGKGKRRLGLKYRRSVHVSFKPLLGLASKLFEKAEKEVAPFV